MQSFILPSGAFADTLLLSIQGVYVLSDNAFRPLTRMSMTVRSEAVARAEAVRVFSNLPTRLGEETNQYIQTVFMVPLWPYQRMFGEFRY